MPGLRRTVLTFDDLRGWSTDDHRAALDVFRATSDLLPPDWAGALAMLAQHSDPRVGFEAAFDPVLIEDDQSPLFTAYYEPELDARLLPEPGFTAPICQPPWGWTEGQLWLTRAEIAATDALAGREIAWLRDEAEAFFLQVQGSGRLRLPGGESLRVGFAGKNGHPYASVGQEMIRRGLVSAKDISADTIKSWLRANPRDVRALLNHNPSFVFFRPLDLDAELGPLGSAGVPVTAGRSLAVDPAILPYGTPLWLETEGAETFHRLMVAQDTGSAIRGAQRADIFMGTGEEAGQRAGRVAQGGRMVALLPKGTL